MYAVVLMAAMGPCGGPGYGFGTGVYQHGYGAFSPRVCCGCGVVLPPAWGCDDVTEDEKRDWFTYVELLEAAEREDMLHVWKVATPEARRALLAKIPAVAAAAAEYRAKVERERAVEKYKEQNRPLTDEELAVWEAYIAKLKGDPRKVALQMWKDTDNRGRRLLLKELLQRMKDDDE